MYIDTSNASSGRVCLNAAKADQLATARTITLSGDASGSVSFDGSQNVTLAVDISALDDINDAIDTKQATITGAATTITSSNLTASRALVSNSSGKVAVSAVTSTELGYLDGVTSNIQTQLDGKAASSHNHSASNITSGTLSSDRLPTVPIAKGGTGATTAAGALTNLGITATAAELNKMDGVTASTAELNYVDGVTSNIQTQLDEKANSNHTHNYAGSSSAGGAATSANKLNTDAGSATQPVYFSNGIPVKTTYTLGASVPSNAKFTDTVYTLPAAGSSLGGVKSGGDVTISDGVITVKDDSHNHTIANIDNLQTTLDAKAAKNTGIFYIEGTGDTAGTWLGSHSDITEYYAGLILAYKIGVAGLSSGTTLNINNLGAVTVVKNATSAISTNFAVNSVIFLVYTIDSSGTAYWKAHDYDSNTKTTTGTSNKASTKLFLTGATSQTSSGTTTYSNSKVYIGTDNCLYSNGEKVSTTDTNTTYTFATGSSNGTISVTPSGGTATNVAVKGLGSAAYTASTAYDAAGTAQTKADAALASAKTYADGIKNDLLNGAGAAYDTLKELGDLIDDNTDAIDALEIVATNKADKSHTHAASDITSGTLASARIPAATTSAIGGVKIGSNIKVSSGTISVPTANGTTAGVTIVYPAASCTTFSSDSGTVTPLAVQKGAKMFAITRPSSSTNKAITRYSNTTGDVQDSKIIIEDVTNARDSSKKAQVIAIPAEGGKKMVYGYCTDQIDGTSFIGGVFDANATEYPYAAGLAIGGTSGNLLWKGVKVATTSDIPSVGNGTVTIKQNGTSKGSFTLNQSGNATIELTDTDTNTTYSAATQSAAGLMSAADKKKLDGIATGANNYTYTLPSATSSVLGGVKVGSNITVSSGTISLTKSNVTSALGYTPPTTNTTYSAATQSTAGLMSAADKKKLDGVATGANAYSLPTASSSTLGGVKTTSTVTSTSGLTACPIIKGVPYYKDTNTTYSLSSFGVTATAAELNYVDGVTSNIQTQLNGKLPITGGTITGTTGLIIDGTNVTDQVGYNYSLAVITNASKLGGIAVTNASDRALCIFMDPGGSMGLADGVTGDGICYKYGNNYHLGPSGVYSNGSVLYGAAWNDYAEYRSQKEEIKPGYCVASADNGQVYKTTEKFQACDGIVSDTFGFAIGETDECKTPLAVAGRVLAYCEGNRYNYNAGDTVCAGPDGRVVKMTREEIREWPDRIIGIVSEIPEYKTWGTGNIFVDDRIWIKVK